MDPYRVDPDEHRGLNIGPLTRLFIFHRLRDDDPLGPKPLQRLLDAFRERLEDD